MQVLDDEKRKRILKTAAKMFARKHYHEVRLEDIATKAGVEGQAFQVHAPLIEMTKAEIIRTGVALGVDYGLTVSCYQADAQGVACGACDSCRLRAEGFRTAGVTDPTVYRA